MKYLLRDLTEIKKTAQLPAMDFSYNNITMTPFVQKQIFLLKAVIVDKILRL